MKNTVAKAMSNAFTQLKEETLDQGRRERGRIGGFAVRIDVLFEIGVEVLENKVEEGLAVLLVVNVLYAEESNDVDGMGKHLKERYFSKCCWWYSFFVHF